MKKETTKKLAACLLGLALALTAAGCGSGGEQEADASMTVGNGAADASVTVGSGADVNMNLDTADSLKEGLTITVSYMEKQPGRGRSKLYVDIENTTANNIEVVWRDLIIDGKTASEDSDSGFQNWFPDKWTPTIKAGDTYQEVFFIEHPTVPYAEYAEATIDAVVTDTSQAQTESINVTLSLKDIEIINIEAAVESSTDSPSIHIEEQELYSANGLTVTITEQTLMQSQEPLLHFENQSEDYLFIRFTDTCVNGEAVGIRDAFGDNYYDATPDAGEACDQYITLGDLLITAVDSGADSGEITLTLYISEDMETALDEAEITIPFTIVKE